MYKLNQYYRDNTSIHTYLNNSLISIMHPKSAYTCLKNKYQIWGNAKEESVILSKILMKLNIHRYLQYKYKGKTFCLLYCRTWTAKRARVWISAVFWEPLQSWIPPSFILTNGSSLETPESQSQQTTIATLNDIGSDMLYPLCFWFQ